MDQRVMKKLKADRFIEIAVGFQQFMEDHAREPSSLWELLEHLETTNSTDQRLIGAVTDRARKYEPKLNPKRAC